MKLLISGGHLTPALAFIDYLDQLPDKPEVLFAGRLFSKLNNQQRSKEYEEVVRRGHQFVPLQTGKVTLQKPLLLIPQSALLLKGLLQSFWLLAKYRPTVFVSFGGYLAVPLAVACAIFRIPIITHEQTHSLGIANAFIARFARFVAMSHPITQSKNDQQVQKMVVTGNLIRPAVLKEENVAPTWVLQPLKKPLLYITGGSQGSEIINTTIAQCVRQLTKSWTVIHQCGMSTTKRNYLQELEATRQSLSRTQQNLYYIREWVSESELAWIYTNATAVISRSGANTTEEIARRRIPTIFIPLPFSRHQEQQENALELASQKAALMIQQKQLSPEELLAQLAQLQAHYHQFKRHLSQLTFIPNPAHNLWELAQRAAQ